MYKLDLPIDYKEAAAIERRRNQEEQRKSRIFNAKTRIIGIDKQAIDQQIKDRKQMEEFERRRSEAFGKCSCCSRNLKTACIQVTMSNHSIQHASCIHIS